MLCNRGKCILGMPTRTCGSSTSYRNHLYVNQAPADSHLFVYKHGRGLCPLMKQTFMDHLNSIASLLSIPHLKGHEIRIGSTLEYLLCGAPFDIMEAMGRWAGRSFLLYLHQHAVIMAPYMQAHTVLDTFTQYMMPQSDSTIPSGKQTYTQLLTTGFHSSRVYSFFIALATVLGPRTPSFFPHINSSWDTDFA